MNIKNIILITFLLITTFYGKACSCTYFAGVKDVDVVLIGEVIKIKQKRNYIAVTISVKKELKGAITNKKLLKLITNREVSACGFHFKEQMIYAIYGNLTKKGKLYINRCSKTKKIEKTQVPNYTPEKSSWGI